MNDTPKRKTPQVFLTQVRPRDWNPAAEQDQWRYDVRQVNNAVDPRIHDRLDRDQVQALIDQGYDVRIT